MVFIVRPDGAIVDCDAASEQLLKRNRSDITGRSIGEIFPALAGIPLVTGSALNSRLHYGAWIGCRYDAVAADNRQVACRLFLNLLEGRSGRHVTVIAEPLPVALS